MATVIPATNSVVGQATTATTYNEWFVTQLIGKFGTNKAPLTVTLQRSATVNGVTVLAPNTTQDNSVTFTIDAYQAATNTPAVASALEAVIAAVTAVAASKKLL